MLERLKNSVSLAVLSVVGVVGFIVYLFTKNDRLARELARKKNELKLKEAKDEINRVSKRADAALQRYRDAKQKYDSNRK